MSGASNFPYNGFIPEFTRTKSILIRNLFYCFSLAMVDLYNYSLTDLPQRRAAEQPMTRYRRQWRARIRALMDYGCRDLDRLIRDFYDRPGVEANQNVLAAFMDSEVTEFQIACADLINSVDRFFEACLDILEEPIVGNPRILVVFERPLGDDYFRPIPLPNWEAFVRLLLEGRCMLAIMMVLTTICTARERFVAGTSIDQVLTDAVTTVESITDRMEGIQEDEEVVAITINSH